MKKNYTSLFVTLFVVAVVVFAFLGQMPQWTAEEEGTLTEFSTYRAFNQVKALSQKPHYVGSTQHKLVRRYLINELKKLGLEPSIQEGYTMTEKGNLTKSSNIIARIKGSGSGKSLLLLSHYDSAPHSSSLGASDAGSGVATILEGIRTFLYNKPPHKNDIIILFSDAEELGLNGAALFVTQHQWAKEIGVVLNFEARGSSGPSYMLMETNGGNAGLVRAFAAADVPIPNSNSLMYSIYKMLPNDTDLTIFREQGNIQGYNFAFIDDHFNYHSAQDDSQHLNKNSLEHQGTYLMPLLHYFSNADFNQTLDHEDYVYFSVPFAFFSYPFSWIFPMVISCFVVFVLLLFIGLGKRVLDLKEMIKGFIPFLGSVLASGVLTYLGWKLFLNLYPQYQDLLNGFTYNGHSYIAGFAALSIGICFVFYQLFSETKHTMSQYVVPLLFWLVINLVLAFQLPGAAFLLLPVLFGLIAFASYIFTQKSNTILNFICAVPTLLIIVPFIQMFPVGLGLKILFGSSILTALVFTLLLPLFGAYAKKGVWSVLFFMLAIGLFIQANNNAGYELGKAKSNSLLYIYNVDTQKTNWVTYDTNLDYWTKTYLGEDPKTVAFLDQNNLTSKYNSGFTYSAPAPKKNIAKPTIEILRNQIYQNRRYIKIRISSNRKVNRYDLFANEDSTLFNLKANGVSALGQKGSIYERHRGKKIVSYYVVDNEPLELEFSTELEVDPKLELLESSFDLMSHPLIKVSPRASWMIPTPFVLNDAVVVRQKIDLKTKVIPQIEKNTTVQKKP